MDLKKFENKILKSIKNKKLLATIKPYLKIKILLF